MLALDDFNKIKASMEEMVDLLGVPATWTQTKPPNGTAEIIIGFKTIGVRDEELVNAYGVGGKVVTIKVSDIPVVEKFDRITVMSERYTIDDLVPIHLNGEHLFHKGFIKGK